MSKPQKLNRDWISFHLTDAKEEIEQTLSDLRQDSDYGEEEFRVAMEHLYHHVNTAWNSRAVSKAKAEESAESDFFAWRAFPKDLTLETEAT